MVSSADISWRKDNVEFTTLERNLVSNSVLEYTFAYTADRSVLRAEAGGGHGGAAARISRGCERRDRAIRCLGCMDTRRVECEGSEDEEEAEEDEEFPMEWNSETSVSLR